MVYRAVMPRSRTTAKQMFHCRACWMNTAPAYMSTCTETHTDLFKSDYKISSVNLIFFLFNILTDIFVKMQINRYKTQRNNCILLPPNLFCKYSGIVVTCKVMENNTNLHNFYLFHTNSKNNQKRTVACGYVCVYTLYTVQKFGVSK